MNVLVTELGPWRVGILMSDANCRLDSASMNKDLDIPIPQASALARRRAGTVDIRRVGGGMMPRALVAGIVEPNGEPVVRLRVPYTSQDIPNAPRDCQGLIGSPLASGLPLEFAIAAIDGIQGSAWTRKRSSLSLTGAGYDRVESSPCIFRHAGELLAWLLLADDFVSVPNESHVLAAISAWS